MHPDKNFANVMSIATIGTNSQYMKTKILYQTCKKNAMLLYVLFYQKIHLALWKFKNKPLVNSKRFTISLIIPSQKCVCVYVRVRMCCRICVCVCVYVYMCVCKLETPVHIYTGTTCIMFKSGYLMSR